MRLRQRRVQLLVVWFSFATIMSGNPWSLSMQYDTRIILAFLDGMQV
jgi:hypothetical protein